MPDQIAEMEMSAGTYKLSDLLTAAGLASSKGEARRLIEQGGVKVDGERSSNSASDIEVNAAGVLLQVGKRRFLRIRS
jgi:tyrosyl-tRNA synthetase